MKLILLAIIYINYCLACSWISPSSVKDMRGSMDILETNKQNLYDILTEEGMPRSQIDSIYDEIKRRISAGEAQWAGTNFYPVNPQAGRVTRGGNGLLPPNIHNRWVEAVANNADNASDVVSLARQKVTEIGKLRRLEDTLRRRTDLATRVAPNTGSLRGREFISLDTTLNTPLVNRANELLGNTPGQPIFIEFLDDAAGVRIQGPIAGQQRIFSADEFAEIFLGH